MNQPGVWLAVVLALCLALIVLSYRLGVTKKCGEATQPEPAAAAAAAATTTTNPGAA